jgi:uncharacterized membrane protein YeaQ/YmgE (transglycosylase-associated protein family)
MELLLYIIFGALVGWIASIIMGRNAEQGAIGNIVVGILGAFIGGFIMRALGGAGVTGFNIRSFLVALMGAILLLFIYNMVRRGSHRQNTV